MMPHGGHLDSTSVKQQLKTDMNYVGGDLDIRFNDEQANTHGKFLI
jgi:hypothetical protein